MDEQIDDFVCRDADVEGDAELSAERLARPECCCDGDGNEGAAAVVQRGASPGIAEGVDGGQSAEVGAGGGG